MVIEKCLETKGSADEWFMEVLKAQRLGGRPYWTISYRDTTQAEGLMNGLGERRPDYIRGVMWVLQYQLAEVQRPAPAALDLNLVVMVNVRKTIPTAQASSAEEDNHVRPSQVEGCTHTFLCIEDLS
jgi:hypothetical protein